MKRLLQQFIQEYLMPSPIPSLMSLWSSRKRPRLTCVDEVNSHNQSTSCQMIYSLPPPSSSSHAPRIKYDVFISFRGLDTRHGILSHLLEALSRAKIQAYVDYKLREGEELSSALFTAIEESQIALIIFSKGYASSKWCLEELVKITKCMMENEQIVVPIFYDVDPSDVRHQKGCYKNAFAKHEKLFKGNTMNVEKWKTALKKVANLSGFHSINFGTEAELIGRVVRRVLTRLNQNHQVNLKGLIGIDKPIADLKPLISCTGSDVRIIGIWGMGGSGKTTIAGALFNSLRSEYEACCFLANVRVESEKHGIIQLKKNLISILLEEKDLNIDIPHGVPGNILSRLSRTKALIVLDDVDDSYQVTNLIGGHDWLGSGSRIIVTTRDKQMIHKEADDIYEVKALRCDDALKLLNLHAFKHGTHLQMNLHELTRKVVEYAKGVPLALKVLGSFLCGKSAKEWESQLQKLQKMPCKEIQNVLRLSYEGLDGEERSIFLHIACSFYKCASKDVEMLLDACGYSTSIALRNLQDRALIKVSRRGEISMHDLIRQMGHEIVREQNIKRPGELSHLWDPSDIYHVLKHNEGTENIESITLDASRISELSLKPDCFARMVKLKFLRFHYYHYYNRHNHSGDSPSMVHLPEGLGILPSSVRLFHWDGYPLKSFPATFNAEYLVELRMHGSRVEKLWDGVQNLPKLKKIDLWECALVELPDLSKASSLKFIDLSHCKYLLSIHPSIFCLQHLETVRLDCCVRLKELPENISKLSSLEDLFLEETSIKSLPESIKHLPRLAQLRLSNCKRLQSIPEIPPSLFYLNANGCTSLERLFELPENISKLSSLKQLFLEETSIKSLPESIKHLPKLAYLQLSNCERLQSIPEIPASLFFLDAEGCTSLERLFELPENISKLSSLKQLFLEETSIKSLPESIKHLPKLAELRLSNCKKLQSIPEIPASLFSLYARGCTSLERLFTPTPELLEEHIRLMSERILPGLKTNFEFDNCPNLDKDALQAILAYVESSNNR